MDPIEVKRPNQWNAIVSRVGLIVGSGIIWICVSSSAGPLTLIFLFAIVSFAFGGLITRGLGRAATPEKLQYSIGDMYVLIIFLGVLSMPLYPFLGWQAAVASALLIASWWWIGLRMLSRNGIARGSPRLTVLAFSIPMAYGVAPFLLSLGLFLWPMFKEALSSRVPSYFYPYQYVLLALLFGIWASFLCISIFASRASLRSALLESKR